MVEASVAITVVGDGQVLAEFDVLGDDLRAAARGIAFQCIRPESSLHIDRGESGILLSFRTRGRGRTPGAILSHGDLDSLLDTKGPPSL